MWSGALRLRPIKRSSESRNPSVWRSGRLKTTRSVNAVRTARFEYRRWPPRRPFFGGIHAAIASSLSQIVTSPRLLRPRSYSLQFRILYFVLYWRLTRLDFAATTTLPPPDLYDGLDPTPAASVLAYTDSCTNAPLTPYSLGGASVGVVTVDGATRTNAGVFNNSNRSQTVTARVHYTGSNDPDQTITFSLPPKGWAQKSVSTRGERGHIIWRMPQEAYLWVVSVDNQSNDGTLSVPAPNR